MKKKKILLVLGGASKERKISLKSGIACYKALKNLGHSVQKFDPLKEDLASIRKKNTTLSLMPYMEKVERMELYKPFLNF